MPQKSIRLSIISIAIACLALLLTTIPSFIIEDRIDQLEAETRVQKEPVSFEIKGFKISLGKEKERRVKVDNSEHIAKLNEYLLMSKIAMVLASVCAIFSALYAWTREKKTPLSIGSIITACIALSWQYVAVGVSTGVAIFIIILLAVNLGF